PRARSSTFQGDVEIGCAVLGQCVDRHVDNLNLCAETRTKKIICVERLSRSCTAVKRSGQCRRHREGSHRARVVPFHRIDASPSSVSPTLAVGEYPSK